MNVTRIRKLIRQSEHKSWYKTITIKLKYQHADFEIEIEGLDSIYQFFQKQFEFYDAIDELPVILTPSKNHFKSIIDNIEGFVISYLEGNSSNNQYGWNRISNLLELSFSGVNYFFNKESATTDFLLKLDSEYDGASIGAYDFFTNQAFKYDNSDKNYFIGWHRAYEFFTQDVDFVKRRNSERQTLGRIRSEYIKKIEKTDSLVSNYIAEKEEEYLSKEAAITKLIKRKNRQYEDWKKGSKDDFSSFLTNSDNSFKKLEELYQEKLKLEAPAVYWKNRATKLKDEGNKWLYFLIGVTIVSVLALGIVLYLISDGTLRELFDKTGSAVRWSIVFITFVSFLAYAIRTFAKLMFSSYHLSRDAEEREQLTYVYLALKKEGDVDSTERNLIMQSLFSRVDSGLLKDDTSPTMPGGSILNKYMGGG